MRRPLRNQSAGKTIVYEDEGLTFIETICQEYGGNNCVFSAGFVEGENKPAEDSIYIRLEKDGVEPTLLLLRPDEAQILAWIASGVVWSHLMDQLHDEDEKLIKKLNSKETMIIKKAITD